jgi:hypothetical protein
MGGGLTMSNKRKRKKPKQRVRKFRGSKRRVIRKPTISSITIGLASRSLKSTSALPAIQAAKATKMTAVIVCTIVVVRWVIITIGMAASVPQVPGILGRKPVKHPVAKKTTKSFLRVAFIELGILC